MKQVGEQLADDNKYFGYSPLEYFPWLIYPKGLSDIPEIDPELYPLYVSAISNSISEKYDIFGYTNDWKKNLSLELGGESDNNIYCILKKINIGFIIKGNVLYVITKDDNTEPSQQTEEYKVSSWEDVERIKLQYIIKDEKSALEYINILKRIDSFFEIIDFVNAEMEMQNVIIGCDDILYPLPVYKISNIEKIEKLILMDPDENSKFTINIKKCKKHYSNIIGGNNYKNTPCVIINKGKDNNNNSPLISKMEDHKMINVSNMWTKRKIYIFI